MIKSDYFYEAFISGFSSLQSPTAVSKKRGKIAKYLIESSAGPLELWFKVNSKASAIPYQAGEFWPELISGQLRYDSQDDGTVSWYQYTDETQRAAMSALQQQVYAKVAAQDNFENDLWRQMRDNSLYLLQLFAEEEFKPNSPHSRLFYLDEEDAYSWGALFVSHFATWLERFNTQPETLNTYMWRVEWTNIS